MVKSYRIGSAQINCTVGDLKGNCARMMEYVEKAKKSDVDIVVFPELAVTGYPPEDLLLKPKFIDDNLAALRDLSGSIKGVVAVIGFVNRENGDLYNAACVVCDGEIKGIYHKTLLPNYGVFDEKRYFCSGNEPVVFRLGELIFGVNICEDIWFSEGPTAMQALAGATLILNMNASPYHAGKIKVREEIVSKQATTHGIVVSYTNLVGGQDELVFDGQSMVVDDTGRVIGRALAFKEDMLVVDIPREILAKRQLRGPKKGVSGTRVITVADSVIQREKSPVTREEVGILEPVEETYEALLLGLRDYVEKNGFRGVTIGLSGGIDSAIVAAIAVDALGKDRLTGVLMSSRYTSKESEEDAKELAERLGIRLLEVPIDAIYKAYLSTLEPFFKGLKEDITEENLQARIRGNILMALSNKFGWLVLTTGNKSEMSVGYATLYGDMAGGFAVIKDVPKTLVYKLAVYRNLSGLVIPERIIAKEPTAELKPDQKDRDTLPPYDTLDPILKAYVEEDKHPDEIVSPLLDREVVDRVSNMVDHSEYKRRQSPPGIKITPKAFGKDRRMPITNKYRG
ncbi:MAG: Glutamine-dependent NAD(+) synthetase [Syntrophorhabdus sp. PtaU1.Bin050]|nr:MAG: Glutamine-dependent NAD(+) synthetase [Syntrophorhabdus sp. PtaU1.Bin050]